MSERLANLRLGRFGRDRGEGQRDRADNKNPEHSRVAQLVV